VPDDTGPLTDNEHDDPDHVRRFRKTRRHLPHWQAPGASHFLTFTLLDPGVCDLTDGRLAPIIIDALQHWHRERYVLHDYTVMPDHVHVLLQPAKTAAGWVSLRKITHSLKTWTARQANEAIGRKGTLGQDETFDHVVRDRREFNEIAHYIWMNPVRAGLVERPTDWPWWGRGLYQRPPGHEDD